MAPAEGARGACPQRVLGKAAHTSDRGLGRLPKRLGMGPPEKELLVNREYIYIYIANREYIHQQRIPMCVEIWRIRIFKDFKVTKQIIKK